MGFFAAIASTNAVIAASCANEAFKIATSSASYLDNYMWVFLCLFGFKHCSQQLMESPSVLSLLSNRLYVGTHSVYTHTFSLDKKEDCAVCGQEAVEVTRPGDSTLQDMVDWLVASPNLSVSTAFLLPICLPLISTLRSFCLINCSQIKRPSLMQGPTQLFMQGPPQLKAATAPNLDKKLSELFNSGDDIVVTDTSLPFNLGLRVTLT